MGKVYWDDYSQKFPFDNIRLVFSNKKYNIKDMVGLERFSGEVGLDPKNLISLKQVHSSNVISAIKPGIYADVDGIINKGGELVCSIQVSDCLPIFFANNNSKTIGLVHAGWRGLSLGILPEFINKVNCFKESVSEYNVLIGPSIQSCCFEIRNDVLHRFDSKFYNNNGSKKYSVDLQGWAVNQLVSSGIKREKIKVIKKCTFCSNTLYHSYRRDGTNVDRMFALIGWLN